MTDPHYHSGQPRNQLTIGVQAEPSAKRADVQHGAAGVGDVRWRDEKSAPKTGGRKKRPQDKPKKRPQDEAKKRHDIINPVCLCGVVSEGDLKALLRAKGQVAWCSRVRVCGLLALIEYFLRHKKNGVLGISADTARDYVSKRRNNYPAGTIKEPLPLLCHVGILKLARPGVHAHVHTPAVYRLGDAYVEQFEIRVHFTPLMARKFATAESRRERRLNRNFPYREQLLRDLRGVSFAPEARPIIANGITGVGMCNLAQIVSAIDGRKHDVRVSERGQITTSIGSCPRELRPHLLLNGEPVTDCDISNANWNFLPELLADRLRHVSNQLSREKYIADGSREHERLTLLLSDGDFYRAWCKDPANDTEREEKNRF